MIERIEKLKQQIETSDLVDFAPFGEGASAEWVAKAEAHLGVVLPASYKWWLQNFGGGEICGEEIYSIYEMDFDEVVGGDIVYMAKTNQDNGVLDNDRLAICEPPDSHEIFYFKLSEQLEDEIPIYVFDKINSVEKKYADDFFEFLEKRIEYFS